MTHTLSPRSVFGLAQGLALAATVGVALMVAAAVLPGLVGMVPLVVISGSMQPSLHVGDMVVTRKVDPESLQVGDVITYRAGPDLNTHRIVGIETTPKGTVFRTKGDANSSLDAEPVSAERILAKVAYRIPFVGYLVDFVESGPGKMLFIVAPVIVLGVLSIDRPVARNLRLPAFVMRKGGAFNGSFDSTRPQNNSYRPRSPIRFREPWLTDAGSDRNSSRSSNQWRDSRSPIKWREP